MLRLRNMLSSDPEAQLQAVRGPGTNLDLWSEAWLGPPRVSSDDTA